MNIKLTIGQFYPGDSVIHALDARVKLAGTFFFIVSLFYADNFYGYLAAFILLSAVIVLSGVPPRLLLRGIRSILFIIVFAAVFNIFFNPGETVLLEWQFIRISYEGAITAARMVIRLALLITASSVMTLTTSPIQLTDALEYLLKPLKKIKVPTHEIAMMMTIALRFIPTLLEETDKIIKAQTARGADFVTGSIMKRAKNLIPLLVPLFVSAFRRADELAVAMDARCYRGDTGRTKMKVMKLRGRDAAAIIILAAYSVLLWLTKMA
ncbi:MAG: energy-coupling factor transporter transmembrane protein EcfT [Defluviitaleaceae bacterium]|nr:energy-coupling factor transporter transmembrane protein EcfT [Defluviitaleaceae bacterium]